MNGIGDDEVSPAKICETVAPRVEYELTKLGESLLVPMRGFVNWLEKKQEKIIEARKKFDSKNKTS